MVLVCLAVSDTTALGVLWGPRFLSSLWQQPSHSKCEFDGGCCLWSSVKPKARLLLAMWQCLSYSNCNFPPNYSLQDHQAVLRQQIWLLLKDSQIAITKGLNLLLMGNFHMENLTVAPSPALPVSKAVALKAFWQRNLIKCLLEIQENYISKQACG